MWRCTYSDSRCSEGQAEEQRQWTDFLSWEDVWQRQTAIITTVPRMHRLENIRQLQEVKTDNRGGQNRELQNRTQTDAKQMNKVCGDEEKYFNTKIHML